MLKPMTDDELRERWEARIPQWELHLDPTHLRTCCAYLAGLRHHEPEDYDLRLLSLELQRRLYG